MKSVFISRQKVYWDMLDLLGVLHNARYILMFERARFDFWSHLGIVPGVTLHDWPYLVARNEINYRTPVRSEQEVTVTVTINKIGSSSVIFRHTLMDESGTVAADGYTTLVRIDPQSNRPIPWSPEFRELLQPYTE